MEKRKNKSKREQQQQQQEQQQQQNKITEISHGIEYLQGKVFCIIAFWTSRSFKKAESFFMPF